MTKLYNKITELYKRKKLRNEMPQAEKLLWYRLRARQLNNYKFRRQYSIDKYIVDFFCPKAKLAIEIDGDSHYNDVAGKYDLKRENFIKNYNIQIIRFTNKDIYENIEGVMGKINECLKQDLPPPLLSKEGK